MPRTISVLSRSIQHYYNLWREGVWSSDRKWVSFFPSWTIVGFYQFLFTGIEGRDSQTAPVHVINIEIQDNHEEATIGAFLICELLAMLSSSDDLDNDIDELLQDFEAKCQRSVLHCVLFY